MKKIILSVAVATMALSTAAAALEDIKVNGQAKLWYETNNQQSNDLFSKRNKAPGSDNNTSTAGDGFGTSGGVAFKLGVTGKQGNVGFGATIYDVSTMGLENNLVAGTRTNTPTDMYVGEMYITLPVGAKTLLKIGKQELDTPLAYTERWNLVPNTFNAAVAINNSIDNLTLIGAYVGQSDDETTWKSGGIVDDSFYKGAYAFGGLYKNSAMALNAWYYDVLGTADAVWVDAAMEVSGINAKLYAAKMMPNGANATDTTGLAASASAKVSGITLFGAVAKISDKGTMAVGNTATGFKKTKLPTAGVYTDGVYVAQNGSKSFKLKASGKLGTTGIALQAIQNNNDKTATKETTEIDLILTQKVGDVNFKAILMDRSFKDSTTDKDLGAQHVRVIASVNF